MATPKKKKSAEKEIIKPQERPRKKGSATSESSMAAELKNFEHGGEKPAR